MSYSKLDNSLFITKYSTKYFCHSYHYFATIYLVYTLVSAMSLGFQMDIFYDRKQVTKFVRATFHCCYFRLLERYLINTNTKYKH